MSHKPSPIVIDSPLPTLQEVDLFSTISSKSKYEKSLKSWQQRMLAVQQAYYQQDRRAILVFEGWDAGGKGGSIRRLTEKLDPRGFQVYPISAPTPEEQGRHYLYRFQTRLPKPGAITIFDRSYYGRVLVERVEGFAKEQEWQRAYQEINEFERTLIDDGVRIVKVFMHIDQDEQLKRFRERLHNPVKRWKLTMEDIRNRNKWREYVKATNQMFAETSTTLAPWNIIAANHKWYARVEVLKAVVTALEAGVDTTPPELDEEIVKAAKKALGIDDLK